MRPEGWDSPESRQDICRKETLYINVNVVGDLFLVHYTIKCIDIEGIVGVFL